MLRQLEGLAVRLTIAIEMVRRANASAAQLPVSLEIPETSVPTFRPQSNFVAHLAATYLCLPQTRARRRAEPLEAAHAYSVASKLR